MTNADITAIEARIADGNSRLDALASEIPTTGWAAKLAATRAEIDDALIELDRAMGVTS